MKEQVLSCEFCEILKEQIFSKTPWKNDKNSHPYVFCENLFLKISQNSQENTCARVSFLIKLLASATLY